MTVSGVGFVVKLPSWSLSASTKDPVRSRMCASRMLCPRSARFGDGDLLESELDAPVVHDDVDELGHVRLEDERCHPGAPDALRVHDAVGPGPLELVGVLLEPYAGHDEELGSQRPGAQSDEQVARVGVERRDEGPRPAHAGAVEDVVVGRVAEDGRERRGLQAGRIVVDDDRLRAHGSEVPRDRASDPAPAADDDVVTHACDLALHSAPPEHLWELALDQRLDNHAERIESGPDAEDDQDDREHLARARERLDLAEPDGRDRGDGLVQRVEDTEAEHDVSDRPRDRDRGEDREGDREAPPIGHDHPPQRYARGWNAHVRSAAWSRRPVTANGAIASHASRSARTHGSGSKRSRKSAASGSTWWSVPRTRTDEPAWCDGSTSSISNALCRAARSRMLPGRVRTAIHSGAPVSTSR